MSELSSRIAAVRDRITAAEASAGVARGSVQLLIASKTQSAETIRAAVLADRALCTSDGSARPAALGENRVQELVLKAHELIATVSQWHLIGQLQTNKVNHAVRWATSIQSITGVDLARRVAERRAVLRQGLDDASGLAAEAASPATGLVAELLDVMLQVNVSGEATKSGCHPDEAADLAAEIAAIPGLRLTGFMTIGARGTTAAEVAGGFARLRAIRDGVLASGAAPAATELSMGMSGDVEIAIAEGSTMVRVGSAIFGARV